MLKKRLISYMLVLGLLTSGGTATANEPCDFEYFMNSILKLSDELGSTENSIYIPEEYSAYSEALLKAVSRGIVSFEELSKLTGMVSKQDAVNILYRMLVSSDSRFEITDEEAEEILNTCYDNGYLKEENKKAYAAMIKYGVIWADRLTNPDKILTKDSLTILEERVTELFKKRLPVNIGGKEICVGISEEELINRMGEPGRKVENEYGFTWFVYDEYYSNFIMIGVKDELVCAYFTNAQNFEFEGIKSGDVTDYVSVIEGLRVIRDASGAVDAVSYNPFSPEAGYEYDVKEQTDELFDMINANRVKHGLLPFSEVYGKSHSGIYPSNETKNLEVNYVTAYEVYTNMLTTVEGGDILAHDNKKPALISADIMTNENSDKIWSITVTDTINTPIPASEVKEAPTVTVKESKPEPLKHIKTPNLISPYETEVTDDGNLVLELEERCADEYFVTLYNVEKESYDVYAYLKNSTNKIVIPSYMLTKGNVYRACVNSVDGDIQLTGNMVEFTYGKCDSPINIVSPENNLATYDDQIEIAVESSAYREFRVDVYNTNNEIVLTKKLIGANECILDSLPAGRYTVYVTAVSHATGLDMGSECSVVEIQPFTPVITEFVLEPGEYYDFYPGDGIEWIYFYDTEVIAVTEKKTTSKSSESEEEEAPAEPAVDPLAPPDWSGVKKNKKKPATPPSEDGTVVEEPVEEEAPAPVQVTETYVVYKTKVTQKKVPATKKYRALAGLTDGIVSTSEYINSRNTYGNGGSTEIGDAIAAMALSFRGVPYVWGGTTPNGFDCSGLVKYVCNSLGIFNIARTSAQQFAKSGRFVDRADLMPGDFVYFQKNGVIHHVGVYIGNNMMVHAPHTGDVVKVSNLSDSYYQKEYAGAKRIY